MFDYKILIRFIRAAKISTLIMTASNSQAEYNKTITGNINNVITYDGGYFLFTLVSMPNGHCKDYFMIPTDVPLDAKQMLLSRALLAKTAGDTISIGYDSQTCVNGWYRAHRIG